MTRSLSLVAVVLIATTANAYPVGPALSLQDLTNKAEVILKAEVLSTDPVALPLSIGGDAVRKFMLE